MVATQKTYMAPLVGSLMSPGSGMFSMVKAVWDRAKPLVVVDVLLVVKNEVNT